MRTWRIGVISILTILLGFPLLFPFLDLITNYSSLDTQENVSRILLVSRNSFILVAGTLLLSLPVGTFLAVLLFRTNVPCRSEFCGLLFFSLFVPLPIFASAWQATLGPGSWLPFVIWTPTAGRPWPQGLMPAIWVHGLYAIPWVAILAGNTLRCIEPELEEDALMIMPARKVIWSVSLTLCRSTFILAGLLVAIFTANNISVTDLFLVRTYAEEVYLSFNLGEDHPLAVGVLSALPSVFIGCGIIFLLGSQLLSGLSKSMFSGRTPPTFAITKWRWPTFGIVFCFFAIHLAIPVMGLIWRVGLAGNPLSWSVAISLDNIAQSFGNNLSTILASIGGAVLSGIVVSIFALLVAWSLPANSHSQVILLLLITILWILPEPILGLGLKQTILTIVIFVPFPMVSDWLYNGPSPLPTWWGYIIVTFPIAYGLLWPSTRKIPQDLQEAAKLDGATPRQQLVYLYLPLTLGAIFSSMCITTAFALQEIGISQLAGTPGVETFTQIVFDRMHYGVTQEVAAVCLVMLGTLALMAIEIWIRLKKILSPNKIRQG